MPVMARTDTHDVGTVVVVFARGDNTLVHRLIPVVEMFSNGDNLGRGPKRLHFCFNVESLPEFASIAILESYGSSPHDATYFFK